MRPIKLIYIKNLFSDSNLLYFTEGKWNKDIINSLKNFISQKGGIKSKTKLLSTNQFKSEFGSNSIADHQRTQILSSIAKVANNPIPPINSEFHKTLQEFRLGLKFDNELMDKNDSNLINIPPVFMILNWRIGAIDIGNNSALRLTYAYSIKSESNGVSVIFINCGHHEVFNLQYGRGDAPKNPNNQYKKLNNKNQPESILVNNKTSQEIYNKGLSNLLEVSSQIILERLDSNNPYL